MIEWSLESFSTSIHAVYKSHLIEGPSDMFHKPWSKDAIQKVGPWPCRRVGLDQVWQDDPWVGLIGIDYLTAIGMRPFSITILKLVCPMILRSVHQCHG